MAPPIGWFCRQPGKDSWSPRLGGRTSQHALPVKHSRWGSASRDGRKLRGENKEAVREDRCLLIPVLWHGARFRVFRNRWKILQNELIFFFQNKTLIQSTWIRFKVVVHISIWACLFLKSLRATERSQMVQDSKGGHRSQGLDSRELRGVRTEKEAPLHPWTGHAAPVPGLGLGSELARGVSWVGAVCSRC